MTNKEISEMMYEAFCIVCRIRKNRNHHIVGTRVNHLSTEIKTIAIWIKHSHDRGDDLFYLDGYSRYVNSSLGRDLETIISDLKNLENVANEYVGDSILNSVLDLMDVKGITPTKIKSTKDDEDEYI